MSSLNRLFAVSACLAMFVSLAVRITMAFTSCVPVITVAFEKLAGIAPFVLFASSREHRGNGEKSGGNLGLHVEL